jgi:hypothetical protein
MSRFHRVFAAAAGLALASRASLADSSSYASGGRNYGDFDVAQVVRVEPVGGRCA